MHMLHIYMPSMRMHRPHAQAACPGRMPMRMHRWLDLAGRLVRGDSCLAFLHASALKVDKVIRAAGLR